MESTDYLHHLFSSDDVSFFQRHLAHADSLINRELPPQTEKDHYFLEFIESNLNPRTRFERLWRQRENAITVQIQKSTINSLNERIEDLENKNHALTVSVKSTWKTTEKLEKEKAELHAKFLKKIKELEDNLGIEPEPKSPPLTKEFDDGHVDWWREQT